MILEKWAKTILALLISLTLLLGPLTLAVQAGGPGPAQSQDADWEKLSPDLRALLKSNAAGNVPVILQMNQTNGAAATTPQARLDEPEREAKDKIERHGGKASKSLKIVGGASGKVPVDRLSTLSREPAVRYISYDTVLVPMGSPFRGDMVDFARALNADDAWEKGLNGAGVTVAVIDSGVASSPHGVDPRRLVASIDLVKGAQNNMPDPGGHGTHVAGIIAGQDADWSGIAPKANIVSIRVLKDDGTARMSDVIKAIQLAVQNRKKYGIRIINLSLGAPATTSYTRDPLAAAVELAWHAGIVVVTSAGNRGPAAGTISTPGYDPYVVTVGAIDMNATKDRKDDIVASFSSRGPTIDGLPKPDVVAPGRKMVSTRVVGSFLDKLYPDRVVDNYYFRLSGTSQAAAAVSGVAALMLNANKGLVPDQVKQVLMATASKVKGYDANAAGAGYVDAEKAIERKANKKYEQSARPADAFAITVFPLIKGTSPLVWKSLKYNGGVDSRGIPWSNVSWDNVSWDNVTWDNVSWDNVSWDNVSWDNVSWDNVSWDNAAWDNVSWDNPRNNNAAWDNTSWDNAAWDNAAWDNAAWDSAGRID
ncbi:MAG: S8 family serine peptidase [Chloroflexi bacterium]|nr:S8 family serine peptidase [Chloroflexota bacterium]